MEQTHHIILTGTVSENAAKNFFHEFFHEDHGDQPRHGLILSPYAPDNSFETNVLKHHDFASKVFYI